MIFLLVRVADREFSSQRIISVSFSDCELAIENKDILLAINKFLDVSSAQWRTFRLWLLVKQILNFVKIISRIFLN